MSYLVDFPPSSTPLPPEVNSAPYVIFGIKNHNVSSHFPKRIPLAMVLHFAPKLKEWVVPLPPVAEFPVRCAKASLVKPCVGINIHKHITIRGLRFIVNGMLQKVGMEYLNDSFGVLPGILSSCNIVHDWRLLELPEAGLKSIEAHILTRIMLGTPVDLQECKAVWRNFNVSSPILHELVHSYTKGHIACAYGPKESRQIEEWIGAHKGRRKHFNRIQDQYSDILAKPRIAETSVPLRIKDKTTADILERDQTLKVSIGERKERERMDANALRHRLRRLSSESIRSVEYVQEKSETGRSDGSSTPSSTEAQDTSDTTEPEISKGVDPKSLEEALAELRQLNVGQSNPTKSE